MKILFDSNFPIFNALINIILLKEKKTKSQFLLHFNSSIIILKH